MNCGKLIIANLMRGLTLATGVICLTGCSGNWGWYVISPATDQGIINIKFLLGGLKFTILLSVTAIVVAIAAWVVDCSARDLEESARQRHQLDLCGTD